MSARIYLNSMSKLTGLLRNRTVFTHYKQWNPRGLRTFATETGKIELEKHEIKKGFGLIVVNKEFCVSSGFKNRVGADADIKNTAEFCKIAKIETLSDHNLKASKMEKLFNTISETDFSSYDAFICFISSHGNFEGICGTDGKAIPRDKILKPFKNCTSLEGKPKLFFFQSCGGDKKDTVVRHDKVEADHANHIVHPFEADILVASSSVKGYTSYRYEKSGSVFITELTKVFKKYAHNMNLTDMLTIVNNEVSGKNIQVANDESDHHQVPSFSSTLRKAVCFDVPEPKH